MTIGAVSFQPYVYNVNAVSPASMNRLSRISDNVLDKKTDYSGLVEAENENPLKRGQTLDFQSMLEMQMQRGRSNAARIMKLAQEEAGQEGQTEDATVKFGRNGSVSAAWDGREAVAQQVRETTGAQAGEANTGNGGAEDSVSNYRMQQAISAYEMFMTA